MREKITNIMREGQTKRSLGEIAGLIIEQVSEEIEKDGLLSDEEIIGAEDAANTQVWGHGVHPLYEREKVLLQVQLLKILALLRSEKETK